MFSTATKSKQLSFMINELFIEIYHDRVKDMPVRAIFKRKLPEDEDFDQSDSQSCEFDNSQNSIKMKYA